MPPRPLRLIGVLALVAASLLAACEPAGSPAGKPVVPRTGAYMGTWIKPEGDTSPAGIKADWARREAAMGRSYDIGHSFYSFSDPFPSWRETWHAQSGRIPMISWNGTYSAEVVAGRHDALIRQRARAVKALRTPVFLRYFWEPDARKKDARVGSYATYISDFRRVFLLFQQEGATNAAFVWCPTAWGFRSGEAQKFYPGDGYVDWICSDGYNWGNSKSPSSWSDWKTIYSGMYAFGTAHRKPMMAGEWASVEDPGDKAAWLRSTKQQIKAMPGIKAVVYFDSKRYEEGRWLDWRTTSSNGALSAFHELARDPYFDR